MICTACQALSNAQAAQQKRDEPIEKQGGVIAHISRLWHVTRNDPNT